MSTDLVQTDFHDAHDALTIAAHMKQLHDLGAQLVRSGLLPQQVGSAEAAVAIILKGRELGLPVMQAFDSIDVIQGKPTLKPQAMLALIYSSGRFAGIDIDAQDDGATVTMRRSNGMMSKPTEHTETFTKRDAERLGLMNKQNYRQQPKTMFKWRAIGACARVVFPDVVQGMYTPDEVEDMAAAEADDAIDVEVRPAGSAAERLASKLRGKPEPESDAPAEKPAEALDDEFPPEPPAGMFGEDDDTPEPATADDSADNEPEPEPEPGMTAAQARALMTGLSDAGFATDDNGKAQGRRYMSWVLGRTITGAADLTRADAEKVLATMGAYRQNSYTIDRNEVEQSVADWVDYEAMQSEGAPA